MRMKIETAREEIKKKKNRDRKNLISSGRRVEHLKKIKPVASY